MTCVESHVGEDLFFTMATVTAMGAPSLVGEARCIWSFLGKGVRCEAWGMGHRAECQLSVVRCPLWKG
jgi:hypothetical protein